MIPLLTLVAQAADLNFGNLSFRNRWVEQDRLVGLILLPNLAQRFRLRLEMVRFGDLDLSVAQIATALQAHHQTVGKFLNALLAAGIGAGFEALQDKPHHGLRAYLNRPATL